RRQASGAPPRARRGPESGTPRPESSTPSGREGGRTERSRARLAPSTSGSRRGLFGPAGGPGLGLVVVAVAALHGGKRGHRHGGRVAKGGAHAHGKRALADRALDGGAVLAEEGARPVGGLSREDVPRRAVERPRARAAG